MSNLKPAGESNHGDFDEEEARDEPTSLLPARVKTTSDITGMTGGGSGGVSEQPKGPRRRKTKSDLVLMMTLPTDHEEKTRRRQKSSSDLITKWGYAPSLGYDDLRMAETLHETGTRRERQKSGLSDSEFKAKIEEQTIQEDEFVLNHVGLTSEEAAKRLEEYGRNELPETVEPKWLLFVKQFWAPMPIMIWIAIIIELAIQNYLDMGILLAIQFTNASISFYESNKAGNAIAALKSSLKPTATCKRDGKFDVIDAGLLVPGDTVLLGSGSAVPADCRVNSSEIDVDQAALTGESLPVTFFKNDSVKMGSTVVRGEVEATVEFTGANTFFGKTASLLGETHEASHLQKILMSVSNDEGAERKERRIYISLHLHVLTNFNMFSLRLSQIMFILVGLSVTLCIINFAYLVATGTSVDEALSFTIVLLVASIPLAIEIVTTTTLAIGSKNLVKHGAIVAKLSAIEDLAGMSILCSDKTGTLTLNQMVLQDDTPIYCDGETQESVLVYAALAAKWEEPARDALDRLTLGSVNYELLKNYEQTEFMPFDPTVKRTEGTLKDKTTGKTFKTSKGAPHIILQLLADNDHDVREAVEKDVARLGEKGVRSLAVAKTNDKGVFKMMGLLTFLDPPRPDTKQTIADANAYGVGVKVRWSFESTCL
jgi:H+-transporting ATPase